jgi:hypothetical protein
MDKKTTFLFSAFIAIFFYIVLVLLFLVYIKKDRVKKYANNTTQTALEINIISKPKEKVVQKQTSQTNIKKIEKTIVKKSASNQATKKADLKSLFKDVNTKANKVVQKNVNKIKANEVESRFKSKYQREKKSDDIKLSKLIDVKDSNSAQNKQNISQNNIGEQDKYFSMINDMILRRWYNYPLLNNQDYTVVVNITIDTQGTFSYHIVNFSGVKNVDTTIKEFLENQLLENYPISPDKNTKTIKINFKPDINN